MAIEVIADSVEQAYRETLWKLRTCGSKESSRNGDVVTIQDLFILRLLNPRDRVLLCPTRNANPYFHVMETVWMFAGEMGVEWISQFNKRMRDYADNGKIQGAYGHRWFTKWGDQVKFVIYKLRDDPTTRQAVIAMWDPIVDGHLNKDNPCNTHICFRVTDERLNMTVFNRSNDVVWGMLGANVVHMTYLHEFISIACGIPLGEYRVVSNNLHFYTDLYPNGDDIWNGLVEGPSSYPCKRVKILEHKDLFDQFRLDCMRFVEGDFDRIESRWLLDVAAPMYYSYRERTLRNRIEIALHIGAEDWKRACVEWLQRNHRGNNHHS